MVKRSRTTLSEIADWDNLVWATARAARGKRTRSAVRSFMDNLEGNLGGLRQDVLNGSIEVGRSACFQIFDPKPRIIHAPVFRERVLHHAIMRHVGPVLERSLVDDTFACREGKGAIAAMQRAQHHSRRYAWYGKLDVRQYFPSISHAALLAMLRRKFKDRGLFRLFERIVDAHHACPGHGLPIGALTSQSFANFYLNPLDRFLLEKLHVCGMVRYMDDVVWWCETKQEAKSIAARAEQFFRVALSLEIRPPIQINLAARGVSVCGYRVFPGRIRLSRRRRQRYQFTRHKWETHFAAGRIDELTLQAGYASALGITLHADSKAWRRRELDLHPMVASCARI